MFSDTHLIDFFNGFRAGIYGAVIGIIIIVFVKNLIVLKDDAKIRKRYIKFTDERERNIIYKSAILQLRITIIVSLIGSIISGFFNAYVFFTLISVEIFSGYGFMLIKRIYSKVI